MYSMCIYEYVYIDVVYINIDNYIELYSFDFDFGLK